MKSRWRKTLFAVLTLVLLFALFVVIERVRGRRMLAREIAALRAQGEKLTVAELMPPLAPAEQNGASEFLSAAGGLNSVLVSMEVPGAWKPVAPGKVRLATKYRQWPDSNSSKSKGTNFVTAEQLIEEIQSAQASLDAIHAALRQPALQFNTTYSLSQPTFIHYLAPCKKAGQWLRAASLGALFQADRDGSLLCLESGALLTRKLSEDRCLISQLVAIAIGQISIAATWEAQQAPGWTEPQLARLQAAWVEPNFILRMTHSLEMERAMGQDYFGQVVTDEKLLTMLYGFQSATFGGSSGTITVPRNLDEAPQFLNSLAEATGQGFQRGVHIPLWRLAWADQDQVQLLRYWQKSLETLRQAASSNSLQVAKSAFAPEAAKITPNAESNDESVSQRRSFYDRCRFLISPLLGSSLMKAINRAFVMETWRWLAVTAIALDRYRLRHGKLPPELMALVPDFLPAVPLDPMDGQPLRYRLKTDGGFVLYSVGEDGVDNGGDASVKAGRSILVSNGKDLVWPAVATAEEIAQAEAKRK